MKLIKLFFLVISLLLLNGCNNVAFGPVYSQEHALQHGQTGIYLYTKNQNYHYLMESPHVYIDGKLLGPLPNNGYLYTRLGAGTHKLSIQYKKSFWSKQTTEAVVILRPHQIKYFKAAWQKNGGARTLSNGVVLPDDNWTVQEIADVIGETDMQNLHWVIT